MICQPVVDFVELEEFRDEAEDVLLADVEFDVELEMFVEFEVVVLAEASAR